MWEIFLEGACPKIWSRWKSFVCPPVRSNLPIAAGRPILRDVLHLCHTTGIIHRTSIVLATQWELEQNFTHIERV